MQPKSLKYFDWFEDVQPAICIKMGIDEKFFRKYHEIDATLWGNKFYKDGKRVWMAAFGEQVRNKCFACVSVPEDEDASWDWAIKDAHYNMGEWATKVITAFREVCRDHDLCGQRMVIWFSW